MIKKYANSKIDTVYKNLSEFGGFAKTAGKSSDRALFTRVANKLKEIELPSDIDNYIILRNRAISSMEYWGANQNFDAFPDEELRTQYPTFVTCRIDVDHICEDENDEPQDEKIIGIVLDSTYIEPRIYRRGRFIDYNELDIQAGDQVIGGWIENLWAIDKTRAENHTPGLTTAILKGEITDSSMGCLAAEVECSVCNKRYADVRDVCQDHIGVPEFEEKVDESGRVKYKKGDNGEYLLGKDGKMIKEGNWIIRYTGKGKHHTHNGKTTTAVEVNHKINFFEDSVIMSEEFAVKAGKTAEAGGCGADNRAKIIEHIPIASGSTKKSLLDLVKKVAINESQMKDEYVTLGEEPADITEAKEELENEAQDKLEDGEKKDVMTSYSKYKSLITPTIGWDGFKKAVAKKEGVESLDVKTSVGLKNFYKSALKGDIVFKVRELEKDSKLKTNDIINKLLELGYSKPEIDEAMSYENNFRSGNHHIQSQLKKHILEGISLFEKTSSELAGGVVTDNAPKRHPGSVGNVLDPYHRSLEDTNEGQAPTEADESKPANNSLGYGKTAELYIKIGELDDLLDKLKDVNITEEQGEDKKVVYNDEEKCTCQKGECNCSQKSKSMKTAKDDKQKLNNGRGIERYDGKFNDKEQDLSQKKVNTEDYGDLKLRDKEHSTSDSGAVQKDRKLPKKIKDNRVGESTSDFKENVDGHSKDYPNPYKEDLGTKEMIWKVEQLNKLARVFDPVVKRGDVVETNLGNVGHILAVKDKDYTIGFDDGTNYIYKLNEFKKVFKVNTEGDELKESWEAKADEFGFTALEPLIKEFNKDSDSEGNLADELDKEYIDTHTKRVKKSGLIDYFTGEEGLDYDNLEANTEYSSTMTDEQINEWIMKDEGLQAWATNEGVSPEVVGNLADSHFKMWIDMNREDLENLINGASGNATTAVKKYADDWSPETNYDKKAVEDANLNLKPQDDFKPTTQKQDEGMVKTEEGGGDFMKPIAKKVISIDDDIIVPEGEEGGFEDAITDGLTNGVDPDEASIEVQRKETDLINSLIKEKWVIISATKEALAEGTEFAEKSGLLPENMERNEQLKNDIIAMGYTPLEVKGVYKQNYQGDSYLVYDVPLRNAFELGVKYEQESILIPEGLLFTEGVSPEEVDTYNLQQAPINPVKINPNTGHFDYTIGEEAENEEYYSTFKVGESTVHLSLVLDFTKKFPYNQFPNYVREALSTKQKNQEAEEEHTELDTMEEGGTDLMDIDLTDSDSTVDDLSTDDIDEKQIELGDIDLEDDEEEPKIKAKKTAGVLSTNPADMPGQVGKQVRVRDKNTGAVVETGTASDIGSERDPDGSLQNVIELNGNPSNMKTTDDYTIETIETTSGKNVLAELMSIDFDEEAPVKKIAELDELEIELEGDDVAEGLEELEINFNDVDEEEEPKKVAKVVKKSSFRVNPLADRTKLGGMANDIGSDFFED